MSQDQKAIGVVVKNRNDQYAIIPAELFEKYQLPQGMRGAIEAFYESDVEGQSARYMGELDSSPEFLEVYNHEPFKYGGIE